MTDAQIQEALKSFRTRLQIRLTPEFPSPRRLPEPLQGRPQHQIHTIDQVRHLLYMCDVVETLLEGGGSPKYREKAMRWLGFLQGALWVWGDYTLDQLRAMNRATASGRSPSADPE